MKLRTVGPLVVTLLLVTLHAHAQDHAQHYVLDSFGGVHAGGGAPVMTPGTPYFGFDVAADIEYVAVGTSRATGDGYIVLDKYGGVHYGGALAADPPPSGGTPYFGFDAARAVVRRDVPTRIAYASESSSLLLQYQTSLYTLLLSVKIYAPVDGFLHVTGNAYVGCFGGGNLAFEVSMNVDSTASGTPNLLGRAAIPDCTSAVVGNPTANQNLSVVYPVTAGRHTVNLLGRKAAGTGSASFFGRTLTATFIAANATGELSMAETMPVSTVPDAESGIDR